MKNYSLSTPFSICYLYYLPQVSNLALSMFNRSTKIRAERNWVICLYALSSNFQGWVCMLAHSAPCRFTTTMSQMFSSRSEVLFLTWISTWHNSFLFRNEVFIWRHIVNDFYICIQTHLCIPEYRYYILYITYTI